MLPRNLHPGTTLYVIVGHDNFDHENYIKDVSLSKDEAENLIQRIKPNGTLPDIYWAVPCKLSDLQDPKKHANLDKRFSDPSSISSILRHLEDCFKEANKVDRMLTLMPGKGLLDMYDKMISGKASFGGLNVTKDQVREKILERII